MVYYRKYRPQTISELDLESVRTKLTSILSTKELPHAFLFTGPKGLGKTSSARILAKAINCEVKGEKGKGKSEDFEPCNECDNCISITAGSNIDVLEIDAASNRGIDEIRDLRDKIKYSPASLPKKVYIIDEVHMLTTDAFNALLKTLEEPPEHAVFILCTTEVEKVPATIASRTFHVQFSKPSRQEIINSLERIVTGEKLSVDPAVLDEIYKLSEGAFRDAAKILEELSIASNGSKITLETLNSTYKSANLDVEIQNLLESLSKKDLQNSVKIVEDLVAKGTDFKILTGKLAQKIHQILMFRAKINTEEVNDIAEFNTNDLNELLSEINKSYGQIKFSILPQIPLELVVVGWCLEGNMKKEILNIKNTSVSSQPQQPINSPKPQADVIEPSIPVQPSKDPEPNNDERIATSEASPHGALFSDTTKPENFLVAFLGRLKMDNHSIAGVLRGCKLVSVDDSEVIFETKFKFHRDKLTEPKTIAILDQRASELLAAKVKVVVNLIDK